MTTMEAQRDFLKATGFVVAQQVVPDEARGAPNPPFEKPPPEDAALIDLMPPEALTVGALPLIDAIKARRSRREFTAEALTLEELSFLLWATQGVHEIWTLKRGAKATRRTVPAPGSRHPFETYLYVQRVDSLEPGLYRYLALEHQHCALGPAIPSEKHFWSRFRTSAVTFIWTVIPYRTEWRYDVCAHKMIAQASGHVCQNLYLACEAIGAGTCAVASYWQEDVDAFLGVDGVDEFTIYMAPVGKVA